jgi:hypothetical protein
MPKLPKTEEEKRRVEDAKRKIIDLSKGNPVPVKIDEKMPEVVKAQMRGQSTIKDPDHMTESSDTKIGIAWRKIHKTLADLLLLGPGHSKTESIELEEEKEEK